MKIFRRNRIIKFLTIPAIILVLGLVIFRTATVSAHQSPVGCTGSGLGINLFSDKTQVHIGDTISFSVEVFNGTGVGPVVCDATGITASLVTPDGVNHPITLVRTSLSNGQSDTYTNVVSYVTRSQDVNVSNGTLASTASDTGIIHQNVVDSEGGANQGLNVFVLNNLNVIKVVNNTNGGSSSASDFNIHIKIGGVDVSGSPAVGVGSPGMPYSLIAGTYIVSEDPNASYTSTFSGDCNSVGSVTLLAGDNKTCTITNISIAATPTMTPAPTLTPAPSSSGTKSNSGSSNTSSSTNTTAQCKSSGVNSIPNIILAHRTSPTSIFVSWGPYTGLTNFIVQYGFENGKWQYIPLSNRIAN